MPSLRQGPWKLIVNAADQPQFYNLADDLGETKNLATAKPELVAEMLALLEKFISDGRTTPGARQRNDVKVVRYATVRE